MSIRLRLSLVFVLASAVLLSLGGWLFVATLSSSLLSSIDGQLASQAAQAPQYLSPTARAGSSSGVAGNPPEYLVQIVDTTGRVRAGSEEAGARPVLSTADLNRARRGRILLTQQLEGESERLLAQPLVQRSGWVTVVGTSLSSYDSTISRVIRELAIGCSLFVVLAGAGAYALATGALRPVERLRREVAAIPERGVASPPTTVRVPSTRDEIAALARTMNDLLARLQRALQRERDLIADASHELRTPFTVLRGELELASSPGQDTRGAHRRRAERLPGGGAPDEAHRGSPPPRPARPAPTAAPDRAGRRRSIAGRERERRIRPQRGGRGRLHGRGPARPERSQSTRGASARPSTTSSTTPCASRPPAAGSCSRPGRRGRRS